MKRTTIKTEHEHVLSAEKLREILVVYGYNLSEDVTFSFRVPYSGDFHTYEAIELGEGLYVTWETVETKEEP